MKKKSILCILIVALCSSLIFAADSVEKSRQDKTESKIIVTGTVISKGNLPFVYPGIISDDGTEYTIVCTEKQKRRLLELQGKHLRFTLVNKDDVCWVVKKYKVIK